MIGSLGVSEGSGALASPRTLSFGSSVLGSLSAGVPPVVGGTGSVISALEPSLSTPTPTLISVTASSSELSVLTTRARVGSYSVPAYQSGGG
jgi:hypothetical protein